MTRRTDPLMVSLSLSISTGRTIRSSRSKASAFRSALLVSLVSQPNLISFDLLGVFRFCLNRLDLPEHGLSRTRCQLEFCLLCGLAEHVKSALFVEEVCRCSASPFGGSQVQDSYPKLMKGPDPTCAEPLPYSITPKRSRISRAALRVKVTAVI